MKLKPCPFCGGEAEFEQMGDTRQSCIVICTDCGCSLESADEYHLSGSLWNTRAYEDVNSVSGMEHRLDELKALCTIFEPPYPIYTAGDAYRAIDYRIKSLQEKIDENLD